MPLLLPVSRLFSTQLPLHNIRDCIEFQTIEHALKLAWEQVNNLMPHADEQSKSMTVQSIVNSIMRFAGVKELTLSPSDPNTKP